MEEEEIYDEGISPVKPSGLSALKNKFENPGSGTTKPTTVPKPGIPSKSGNIAAKFGSVATSGYKPPTSGTGFTKPFVGSANKINSNKLNENEEANKEKQTTDPPSLVKRNSKVNIPAAFQTGSAPPPFDKPNTAVKPVPKWKQKQDDSNNNNNKETLTNSNVLKDSVGNTETMLNKDSKPNSLPKKPLPSPSYSGNVKEKANLLFGGVSPSDLKSNLKPVSARLQETKTQDKPEASVKPIIPKRTDSDKGTPTVEFRTKLEQLNKAKRKSVKSIVRSKDNRKFHKVEPDDIQSEEVVPNKPDKLDIEVDWEKLAADFKNLQKDLEAAKSGFEENEEEEYDDIANVMKTESRAISIIQPLTEEEEREWEDNGFEGLTDSDSLPPPPAGFIPNIGSTERRANQKELLEPEEEYDDVGILQQNGQDEGDEELYEPLPDEPLEEIPSPLHPKPGIVQNGTVEKPQPPSVDLIDKKDTKEAEKERKRREKEEKELSKKKEKEFKKKQDDLKQLMNKYKIDAHGLTQSVGKGIVRKTMKGGKKDIAVHQGDQVDIIRMVDNDKGKWLIRILNTDKVGYVDSTNVEVDTYMIRDIMEGSYARQNFLSSSSSVSSSMSASEGDEEGETYEAVDVEEPPDAIEEEIYEECK